MNRSLKEKLFGDVFPKIIMAVLVIAPSTTPACAHSIQLLVSFVRTLTIYRLVLSCPAVLVDKPQSHTSSKRSNRPVLA